MQPRGSEGKRSTRQRTVRRKTWVENVRVTCAVGHHGDRYVARCLEIFAEAHGASIHEAQQNLVKVLQAFFLNGGQRPSPSPAFVDILEVRIPRCSR